MQKPKRTILTFFGTRPEAIKLAPVVIALNKHRRIHQITCNTGQHLEMVHPLLKWFQIQPDISLRLMRKNQTLSQFASRALFSTEEVLKRVKPDIVVCQGDTTTALFVTLAAFHRGIPVAHVEAGLRSGNMEAPWPEEMNRRVIDLVCDYHFTPTRQAKNNLLKEKVKSSSIWITGNTGIDALHWTLSKIKSKGLGPGLFHGVLRSKLRGKNLKRLPLAIITAHRRESFGAGMRSISQAIRALALRYPNILWIFPVHLNPQVKMLMEGQLKNIQNLLLTRPFDYPSFCYLISRCLFVLTDSGGLQEEGPSLGTPVFVMRNLTERPEGARSGNVVLVGTTREYIIREVSRALENPKILKKMSVKRNLYGDGHATERIVHVLTGC